MSLRRPATLALFATSLWVVVCVGTPCLPALEQAEQDAAPGSIPVALVKRDRGQWAICLRVDDFWALVAACGGRPPAGCDWVDAP